MASEESEIAKARLKRAYRYAAAAKVLQQKQYLQMLSVEEFEVEDILDSIDREALDSLPHWCLMEPSAVSELQHIAGGLFAAPALKRCIDGQVLKQWRELLGPQIFDAVLSASNKHQLNQLPTLPDVDAGLVSSNGATILQSTLADHPARILFKDSTAAVFELLPSGLALELYTQAAIIQQRLMSPTVSVA